MIWIFLIALIALALVYLLIVRPILVRQPALSEAFKAEASFTEKLRAKITGWRTYIAAWFTTIAGIIVGLYDQVLPMLAGQDWSPLTAKVPGWMLPVGMVGIGLLFAWLRKLTDNPPVVITQKDDDGDVKVVGLMPPVKA